MDGVPIFSMFPMGLPATDLRGFAGVLNSTSNVVLTEIEKDRSFDEAIKRAQALGVAETDPTADLDGWDAAVKVAALAIVLMDAPVKLEEVQRTGIRGLSEEKIRSVRDAGMRYKLVCRAERRATPRIAGCSLSCCLLRIHLRIWRVRAPRFVLISTSLDCRWLSTIPESRRQGTASSRIFFAPFSREILSGARAVCVIHRL
jgi:homoserine dehydrogenase